MKISAWRQLPLPYPRQMKGDEIRRLCAGHKSGQESAIKMDLYDSKWQLLRYLNQPRHTALQAKSIYCVLRYQGHRSSAARKNRAPPTDKVAALQPQQNRTAKRVADYVHICIIGYSFFAFRHVARCRSPPLLTFAHHKCQKRRKACTRDIFG